MKRLSLVRKTPLRRTGFLKRTEWKPKRKKADIPPAVRVFVRDRSQGVCEVQAEGCTHWATEMHHIQRRSQGGKHTPENLKDCCWHCHHVAIHANVSWAKEQGYLA